jgi:hypothetical protein
VASGRRETRDAPLRHRPNPFACRQLTFGAVPGAASRAPPLRFGLDAGSHPEDSGVNSSGHPSARPATAERPGRTGVWLPRYDVFRRRPCDILARGRHRTPCEVRARTRVSPGASNPRWQRDHAGHYRCRRSLESRVRCGNILGMAPRARRGRSLDALSARNTSPSCTSCTGNNLLLHKALSSR